MLHHPELGIVAVHEKYTFSSVGLFFMRTHKVNLGTDLEIVLQQTPQHPAHTEEMPSLNSS